MPPPPDVPPQPESWVTDALQQAMVLLQHGAAAVCKPVGGKVGGPKTPAVPPPGQVKAATGASLFVPQAVTLDTRLGIKHIYPQHLCLKQ